jgi:hypothetical protein
MWQSDQLLHKKINPQVFNIKEIYENSSINKAMLLNAYLMYWCNNRLFPLIIFYNSLKRLVNIFLYFALISF